MKFAMTAPLCCLLLVLCEASANASDWSPEITRYYREGFTADKIPASVLSVVEAFDNHPLPFQELTYKQSGDVLLKNGRHLLIDTFVSVIPQGGALVTVVGRDSSKEDYASVQYELSYRGLLMLRDQKYFPNAPVITRNYQKLPPDHSPIMEVDALSMDASAFPVGPGKQAVFDFEAGPVGGSPQRMKMHRVCQVGDAFDASEISDAFTGRAERIACDLFDEDGKSRDLHQEKVYLMDYGVALLRKVATANFVAEYKISDVRVGR
jgi:hypothetical protein